MTKLECINQNKASYSRIEKALSAISKNDKLTILVINELTLPWIKGTNWLGGMSDSKRNKAYQRIMAQGYSYEAIEATEDIWMQEVMQAEV